MNYLLATVILALLTIGCSFPSAPSVPATPTATPTPVPSVPATSTATPTPVPSVRVVYAVPSDRVPREDFEAAIRDAVYHVRSWYATQLDGLTFSIAGPAPRLCDLPMEAAHYKDDAGWSRADSGSNRILNDLQDCVAIDRTALYSVWVVYPDVDFNCEGSSLGRGGRGLAILHRGDLEGLIDPTGHVQCGSPPRGAFGWVGGLAHELGHAFGLPHPPGCDENLDSCDFDALMKWGYYSDYPATYLTDDGKAHLRSSRFFHHRQE